MADAEGPPLSSGPATRTARTARTRLYGRDGTPIAGFNQGVKEWLSGALQVVEHQPPMAFDFMRTACDLEIDNITKELRGADRWSAQRRLLSDMTKLMFGDDISGRLSGSLSAENINPAGFRSLLSQSVAKNTGENFLNAMTYVIADCLRHQDEILVDKGTPVPLRPLLTMHRDFETSDGTIRTISVPVESDVAIWRRSAPEQAIIVNAKTRLKEVFHIGTMWKLLYDMLGDDYCLTKWGLRGPSTTPDMLYVFATADMVRATGTRTQGPDVERAEVRNLIAMDASFFDYAFVSKTGIGHVAQELELSAGRESLFHEMGCILDLIEQKFADVNLR